MRNYPMLRKPRNSDCGIVGEITDSGRITGEKNDCTVRALSEALEIPYLEAYGIMLGFGRKFGKGMHVEPVYDSLGLVKIDRPNMSVARFIKEVAPYGNWIIKIRRHVFAVKNGIIFDTVGSKYHVNRHVLSAWKVKD